MPDGSTEVAGETIPFHTFLWKISSRCNINCTYCYVYNSVDDRWRQQPKLMSREVAEIAARRMTDHLQAHGEESASIIFHGGEPLIGGIRHLEMLTDVIRDAFADTEIQVTIGMQTNLLLLTEALADFLLKRGISIGVSLDGPPEINDRHRVDRRGRPTSARLEEKLDLICRPKYSDVFSGFLCVIDPETDPIEVTEYLLSFDPPGIDFLFPLDNHDRPPPGKQEFRDATPYADWLTASYDYWLSRPNRTRVRIFQSIINMMCGGVSLVEALGLRPVDLIVIETNGEIEAVDSLKTTFNGATELGFHIERDSFNTVAQHIGVRSRQLGASALSSECQRCSLVDICGGGYLPHRYSSERGFDNPSVYCADLQMLITHIHRSVSGAVAPVLASATRRAEENGFSSSLGMEESHRPIVALANEVLSTGDARAVVDMGCGNGALLQKIAEETGAIPFGFDLDPGKVSSAQRLLAAGDGQICVANLFASKWPWPEIEFDLCLIALSAFVDAPSDLENRLRRRLVEQTDAVIVYAYSDDLERFGSLSAMAEDAGIALAGPIAGKVAGQVDLARLRRELQDHVSSR